MHQQLHHAFVAFCVLYTVASFLSWLMRQLTQQRQRIADFISLAIKPIDYKNEDLLLRKALTAVNWQLIANKANALHCMKKPAVKTSAIGPSARRFTVPRTNFPKKDCTL
jgi:predicted deacetylase